MPNIKITPSKSKKSTVRATAKRPAAKPAAKTKRIVRVRKTVDLEYSPIKDKMGKAQILQSLQDDCEITPKQSRAVLHTLEQLIFASLCKGSVGQFTLPGVLDIKARKIPAKKIAAIKKGTMVKNPFNGGKEEPHKGRAASVRPATVKPKVRPLAKLRTVVTA